MVSELEKSPSVDQPPHRALALIGARREFFALQGSVVGSYRQRNGRTYGPYYRLAWREDGRQCSMYLGSNPELVEQVRAALAEVQASLREGRLYRRVVRTTRRTLRWCRLQINVHLAPLGLRMKGHEVRGWRHSVYRGMPRIFKLPRMPGLPRLKRMPQLPPTRFPNFHTAAT